MKKIFILSAILVLFFAGPCFAKERVIEIKAKKFEYSPNIIRVDKGDIITIRLISEDVHHGFFLDGYGVETSAHPGVDGSVKFVADRKGKFNFRCSITCGEFHPYMVGYMVVEPNSRFFMYVFAVLILGVSSFLFLIFKGKKENGNGQR